MLMFNLGHLQPSRPSMGAWLVYGLGTENGNLRRYDDQGLLGEPVTDRRKLTRPDQVIQDRGLGEVTFA